MRSKQRYAFYVTAAVLDALGNNLAPSGAMEGIARGEAPSGMSAEVLASHEDALVALEEDGVARADIVALTELPPGRVDAVRRALPGYQCIIADASSTSAGAVLIASRQPCSAGGAAPTTVRPATAQFADVGRMRFAALHARPPWSNERTAQRNAVISAGVAITRAHAFGVLAGDFAGFPNGRRLEDDVTDIDLRAFACGYGAAGPLVESFGFCGGNANRSPNNLLGDGVDTNDRPFLAQFPYLATPHQGYDHMHHVTP